MRRLVIHGQLDQDGHDHPAVRPQVHQHLLQAEQHLGGVVVLKVLEDETLHGLADVLLGHLRDEGLELGVAAALALLAGGGGAVDGRGGAGGAVGGRRGIGLGGAVGLALVVGVVGVDPRELELAAELAPGALAAGTA